MPLVRVLSFVGCALLSCQQAAAQSCDKTCHKSDLNLQYWGVLLQLK